MTTETTSDLAASPPTPRSTLSVAAVIDNGFNRGATPQMARCRPAPLSRAALGSCLGGSAVTEPKAMLLSPALAKAKIGSGK